MNKYVLRFVLFYVLCVGVRASLALLTKRASSEALQTWFAPLFAAIAVGFAIIYAFGLRDNGSETFDNHGIWWNNLRPIHAGLFAIASMYAIRGETRYAYVPLTVDVLIGLLATTYQRFIK